MSALYSLVIVSQLMFPTGVAQENTKVISPLTEVDCVMIKEEFLELESLQKETLELYFDVVSDMEIKKVECVKL